ncbi:MAG TPA: DUF962 domain-containing protein [Kofleriaceae bacterium]|nr:DUF962 domain-containing protein [Kofleriaceae bacterium]
MSSSSDSDTVTDVRKPDTFEAFWPYYVSQHQDPTCRKLHFIGTSIALGCVAVSPIVPQALIAAPIVGYGFAWIGHFVFEKNKPASWMGLKELGWSFRGDLRMWKLTVTRGMDRELERLAAQTA